MYVYETITINCTENVHSTVYVYETITINCTENVHSKVYVYETITIWTFFKGIHDGWGHRVLDGNQRYIVHGTADIVYKIPQHVPCCCTS